MQQELHLNSAKWQKRNKSKRANTKEKELIRVQAGAARAFEENKSAIKDSKRSERKVEEANTN